MYSIIGASRVHSKKPALLAGHIIGEAAWTAGLVVEHQMQQYPRPFVGGV
jgi:hypothetical protein